MYYFTSEIGTTSLQGTKLLAPKCPLFGGSTVEGKGAEGKEKEREKKRNGQKRNSLNRSAGECD